MHGVADAAKNRYFDAGLSAPRLAFHALRATGSTLAHEAGATEEEIQATGGWESRAMVDLYIKRRQTQSALGRWRIDLDDEPAA